MQCKQIDIDLHVVERLCFQREILQQRKRVEFSPDFRRWSSEETDDFVDLKQYTVCYCLIQETRHMLAVPPLGILD